MALSVAKCAGYSTKAGVWVVLVAFLCKASIYILAAFVFFVFFIVNFIAVLFIVNFIVVFFIVKFIFVVSVGSCRWEQPDCGRLHWYRPTVLCPIGVSGLSAVRQALRYVHV
jgi:hypothetical protein